MNQVVTGSIFNGLFDITLFDTLYTFFVNGGWVLLVIAVVYMLFKLYMYEIQEQWYSQQEWVFLSIRTPKENLISTLAVEQIYAQLHAMFTTLAFPDVYLEGKFQLWFALEIVSIGGKISFIIKAPKKTKELVEAAFYAQYPGAEIAEIDDYLKNIDFNTETTPELDIWGTEYKMVANQSLPIKTYRDFEHSASEEKVIDPLKPVLETLAKMGPQEFFGIQLIISPVADDEWKPEGEAKVKELIGEKVPQKVTILGMLMAPLNAVAQFSFYNAVTGGDKKPDTGEKQKNNLMHMTDTEKERVNLIQRKIAKPGYYFKLRNLYIAPKTVFDGNKKTIMIGAFRNFSSAFNNGFKPDTKITWTGVPYKISPALERPYIEYEEKRRKNLFFKAYKARSKGIGNSLAVLNTEEIATLYHLPLSSGTPAPGAVQQIDSKRSQPPADLPVDLPVLE